jgi:hypothetical protein
MDEDEVVGIEVKDEVKVVGLKVKDEYQGCSFPRMRMRMRDEVKDEGRGSRFPRIKGCVSVQVRSVVSHQWFGHW